MKNENCDDELNHKITCENLPLTIDRQHYSAPEIFSLSEIYVETGGATYLLENSNGNWVDGS